MHQPLRLRCDTSALLANYRTLERTAGVATGAAIKAEAYGLGAGAVARHLLGAGCRDFFVSTWAEASLLGDIPRKQLAVLHGLGVDDQPLDGVRPVLISVEQVARWRSSSRGESPCDVMVDTGMNRLGLRTDELAACAGLTIHTLHSHLACADEDHPLNERQLQRFREICEMVEAQRYSLANSAGVFLGHEYAFDLVRPGLALYGGIPRREAAGRIRQVVVPQAQVVQVRQVLAGESVGYGATFSAAADTRIAVINIGYADGYWRAFSSRGQASFGSAVLPVVGRVSMDLVALDAGATPELREGDWVDLSFDLPSSAELTGLSQYELLTHLGSRFCRDWI